MIKVKKKGVKEGFSPVGSADIAFGAYAFIDGIFAVYVDMRVRGDGGRWWMMIQGALVRGARR